MSELQTNTTEDNKFLKRAATTALGLGLVGTGAWAVGQNINNEQSHESIQLVADVQQVELEAYNNSIEAAINSQYDSSQVIGEINVAQDSNLIGPAISIAKSKFDNQIVLDNYGPLRDSANSQNPQPGESYSVVSVDINPVQGDGNEFIVVDSNNINHAEVATIPSPIIEDGSSNESQN